MNISLTVRLAQRYVIDNTVLVDMDLAILCLCQTQAGIGRVATYRFRARLLRHPKGSKFERA